jgi:hypothetical protein
MAANGALSLGEPNEPTYKHKFTRIVAGPHHDFYTAVTSSGSTCYIAFDWQGVQLTSPCDPLSGIDEENAKLQLSSHEQFLASVHQSTLNEMYYTGINFLSYFIRRFINHFLYRII